MTSILVKLNYFFLNVQPHVAILWKRVCRMTLFVILRRL